MIPHSLCNACNVGCMTCGCSCERCKAKRADTSSACGAKARSNPGGYGYVCDLPNGHRGEHGLLESQRASEARSLEPNITPIIVEAKAHTCGVKQGRSSSLSRLDCDACGETQRASDPLRFTRQAPRFKVGDRVVALSLGIGVGTVEEVYEGAETWMVSILRDGTSQNPSSSWRGHAHKETMFEPVQRVNEVPSNCMQCGSTETPKTSAGSCANLAACAARQQQLEVEVDEMQRNAGADLQRAYSPVGGCGCSCHFCMRCTQPSARTQDAVLLLTATTTEHEIRNAIVDAAIAFVDAEGQLQESYGHSAIITFGLGEPEGIALREHVRRFKLRVNKAT